MSSRIIFVFFFFSFLFSAKCFSQVSQTDSLKSGPSDSVIVNYPDSLITRGDTIKSNVTLASPDSLTVSDSVSNPVYVFSIRGKVSNNESGRPVKAHVSYQQLPDREDVGVAETDSLTGNFELLLKKDTRYKIAIQSKGYIGNYIFLEPGKPAPENLNISLVPLVVGQLISLSRITFERGKHKLMDESMGELESIYQMLKENPKMKIKLEGHTDNRGNAKANLALSKKRVEEVKKFLVNKGIASNRISIKAYGGSKPIFIGDSEEEREKNRRVEMRILRN
jgi:outer membrane protein OmpA-like peptidoglycan-associated protein